jgi:hypothetical protein
MVISWFENINLNNPILFGVSCLWFWSVQVPEWEMGKINIRMAKKHTASKWKNSNKINFVFTHFIVVFSHSILSQRAKINMTRVYWCIQSQHTDTAFPLTELTEEPSRHFIEILHRFFYQYSLTSRMENFKKYINLQEKETNFHMRVCSPSFFNNLF